MNGFGPTGYDKPKVFRSAAEKQGDTALWLGKRLTHNPYAKGTEDALRWKKGYLTARRHYRRKY